MRRWIAAVGLLLALGGCSGGGGGSAAGSDQILDPGIPVEPKPSEETAATREQILQALEAIADLDAEGFAARHAVPFEELSFDPLAAANLQVIQTSRIALSDAEMELLARNGFAISGRRAFPTFVHGYQTIYGEDLPIYISADSILHAIHRSYDDILQAIEEQALIPEMRSMLVRMRENLAAGRGGPFGKEAERDADFYLAVALSLLDGKVADPVAGAEKQEVRSFVEQAIAASGARRVQLFGVARNVDFSQFKPRGHYTHTEALRRYFRAQIWLGRIDFRLIETQPDHTQVFHRRQFESALLLASLLDEEAKRSWEILDSTIGAFVGEPDNMTVPEVDALLADLGVTDLAEIAALDDATIAQAIVAGGYGAQRIASHFMVNGLGKGTMPLSSTFLLLGQRYVVDSHVFSNVVYDRVQGGEVLRMMPDPLDVAFAALGNDQAGMLLGEELNRYRYASDLEAMRILVDAHGEAFWNANLYNLWLASLRTLSPGSFDGLPSVARTEAWGRRILNTQLASWAELRHDTILYAKQSYTEGVTCEFPDAYVDPYPEFYAAVGTFAAKGEALVAWLPLSDGYVASRIRVWFQRLGEIASMLEEMAVRQRDGLPLTVEHLDFINRAVWVDSGCGGPATAYGWYGDLFFKQEGAAEFDPTIADVHTQPTDEAGNAVGRILHVATGGPRLMVITVDTCMGPRAYVGLASTYYERILDDWKRMDDPEWSKELLEAPPPDVRWMQDLIGP